MIHLLEEWLSTLVAPPVVECFQKPLRLAASLDVARAVRAAKN